MNVLVTNCFYKLSLSYYYVIDAVWVFSQTMWEVKGVHSQAKVENTGALIPADCLG